MPTRSKIHPSVSAPSYMTKPRNLTLAQAGRVLKDENTTDIMDDWWVHISYSMYRPWSIPNRMRAATACEDYWFNIPWTSGIPS